MTTFAEFKTKHGAPIDCRPVPQAALDQYKDRLPADLIAFWKEHGWCGWGSGLLWVVNPADFDGILEDWVDEPAGKYVYLRTAFGSMFIWDGTDTKLIDVISLDESNLPGGVAPLFNGLLNDEDIYLNPVLRKHIFGEALPRVGPPAADEVYAFVPALPLGGSESAETVQRVKLREHLHLLSQLKE